MRGFFARVLPWFERAGSTFLEAFASALLLTQAFNLDTVEAAAFAAVPAVLSVVYNTLTSWLGVGPSVGKQYFLDLLERTGATFLQTFIGGLIVASHYSLSSLEVSAIAGLAAALAVVKAGAAKLTGSATPSVIGARRVDHSAMRLGRKHLRLDSRTLQLVKYLDLAKLPSHPRATNRAVQAALSWPMYLNDRLGDCTCAAMAHMEQLWAWLAGRQDPAITDNQVLAVYEAVSGYDPSSGANDNGAVEIDVLKFWRRSGIGRRRITAFVQVNERRVAEVKAGAFLFDGLYIGIALPITAQTQTVWDVVRNGGSDAVAGSWGGHAVDVVDYDATGLTVVTWGQLKRMTWAFWHAYVDEAYALISEDALNAKGFTFEGFDLAQLKTDLAAVTR